MNEREIGEIRRHLRRDRSNMTEIFGCYVNGQKEIVSEFRESMGILPENESDKYFGFLRRVLSGTIGKNLIDITFRTAQVADSEEHRNLMKLRDGGLRDEAFRTAFFRKIIDSVSMEDQYLILVGTDTYDVPFKSRDDVTQADNSGEVYRYALCAICPVKQTKSALHYIPEEKTFRDGGIMQTVSAPVLGFLFPAFDDRATNLYNALYYTKDVTTNQDALTDVLFRTRMPLPADQQKKSFGALLVDALEGECSMNVVQNVHDQICQRIALHKESKVPDTLMVSKEEVKGILSESGVNEQHLAKFSVEYDQVFGLEADLHPKNIVDSRHFEIRTPDVSIKVDPTRSDLIETRVIGGVKYIMICADQEIEVNGISIHVDEG